ncbi:MAG: BON domain-containing protein [Calothrix sp. SM1_7_51]|nr:BON domain-containing protein [Calothrix sp. SM1_7_51]
MKKITSFLISSFLIVSAAACNDTAKTSQTAPDSTNEAVQTPDTRAIEASKNDAQSETRRRQLNADIRAREQRNNATGGDTDRDEDDLKSQVRSKLEANIPNGQLVVDATDNGSVTVSGTVLNQQQLNKIEPLAKEIKGVKNVVVKATVAKP